jgi:hypothetical protein
MGSSSNTNEYRYDLTGEKGREKGEWAELRAK